MGESPFLSGVVWGSKQGISLTLKENSGSQRPTFQRGLWVRKTGQNGGGFVLPNSPKEDWGPSSHRAGVLQSFFLGMVRRGHRLDFASLPYPAAHHQLTKLHRKASALLPSLKNPKRFINSGLVAGTPD